MMGIINNDIIKMALIKMDMIENDMIKMVKEVEYLKKVK
jgi:hypothetical protein